MTQAWLGRGAENCRLSRSPARRESLPPGTVVRVLRPRTSPFMPSSAISRCTVCLDTGGRPSAVMARLSQAVIFRRP